MTPEATVIRLLRLCQEVEMAENGLNPNNAMLYAFTNKMKKMKQKKFQNFPKIQRRRTRRVGVSIFIQKMKQFLAGKLFQQIEANVRQGCDVCSFQPVEAASLAAVHKYIFWISS